MDEFPEDAQVFPTAQSLIETFPASAPTHADSLWLESGFYLLLETGDAILLEA
jgi:hypothetical protein